MGRGGAASIRHPVVSQFKRDAPTARHNSAHSRVNALMAEPGAAGRRGDERKRVFEHYRAGCGGAVTAAWIALQWRTRLACDDDELLERRIDVVEIDIGDEAIDAGVDAGRLLAVHIAARRARGRASTCRSASPRRVGGVGSVAADALEMVALGVVFLRLAQAFLRQARVLRISASRNSGQNRSSFQREYDITQ